MRAISMRVETALLLSDLHLEWDRKNPAQFDKVFPERWADAVFLAGDIAGGVHAMPLIEHFLSLGYEVFYILGNHEFYGYSIDELVAQWRQLERESVGFHFLHKDVVETHNLRILGAPLWTSVDTLRTHPVKGIEKVALDGLLRLKVKGMGDFHEIKGFSVEAMIDQFWDQYRWLEKTLQEPTDKQTIVMTHYLPSERSVSPRFKNNALNPCFFTELSHLMHEHEIGYWFHGHTHDTCEYEEGGTQVVCNPRGYRDVSMVNPEFDWRKIVRLQ